ncbi:MAG: hypothetical protein ACXVGC_00215 [Mycobacteriaceae bacterium]
MDGYTRDDLRAMLRLAATDAARHKRCGPRAGCRVRAIAEVDELLDQLAVQDVRPVVGRA